ncbi:hypothetical protein A2773_02235 [Candidatus Gottesmanbacteria bacterium RIFCSPHIGHO2_01_FULL_39_10]|uniref:Amidinotransferase n=1 Tax=Candidatus Gottesmanbacteria bacterium RIFCSPHIGHO2_01_FULL_39_10 TaxID=1798375 RepID=A0A1F5ZQC5_9BACT|nr:MAG: hypothetical protein A2773_02235 [Candidatus Gottesmanbacteria bacterium RIFCSPHIGHO2_01_FULL_39_10]
MKKVLMCRPDYFDIEYEINPWMHMENQVDHDKAFMEWQSVYDSYRAFGVDVELIQQIKGLPDMTFTANGGIVLGDIFVVNNHRHKERKGEEKYFEEWFAKRGYKIFHLKHFQGGQGDALFYRNTLYMGYGFRSDKESHGEIQKILGVKIISLRLINPYFYDFDTAFCPLGDRGVLYYPEAFDQKSRDILKRVENVYPMTRKEAEGFIGNSVLVGDTLFVGYSDDSFKAKIEKLGLKLKVFDMSEFKKSGGGIKCVSLFLDH